jgi:hypothetical protein
MIRLNDMDSTYIDEAVAGFAKRMTDDGILGRQVDLLLLGFAYAIQNDLPPTSKIKRHDLVRVGGIDADTRLAVEATAHWYARKIGETELSEPKQLLEFICRLGSAGVSALQKEWKDRAKSQIEMQILRLTQPAKT